MYEILKNQFNRPEVFTLPKFSQIMGQEKFSKLNWSLHPMTNVYYHEMNPYFLFNLYNDHFYKLSQVITVRDGILPFANFILNHFSKFNQLGAGLFLVHPDLAPIIPTSLQNQFCVWKIVQKNQILLREAKKVILFGNISEQYIGSVSKLAHRIQNLKEIHPDAMIELYFPTRVNTFGSSEKETFALHHILNTLKDFFPNRKINILSSENFLEKGDFHQTYFYDLALGNFLISDNFLHYFVQSRGGTVNNESLPKAPQDSIFSYDLSLYHEFHICPLPKTHNVFIDLLFYKKQNPSVKDYMIDPAFHYLLKKLFKKNGQFSPET